MKRLGLALALCLSLIGGALAQGGMGPGPGMVHSTGGVTCSSSQGNAFLARATAVTNPTDQTNYCTLIDGLEIDGVGCSNTLDLLYILAAPDSATYLLNLCSSSFTLTANGTGTFTANQGYAGNGSTGYLDTNYTPSTNAAFSTLNSTTLGLYDRTSRTASSTTTQFGGKGAATSYSYATVLVAGNQFQSSINASVFPNFTVVTNAQGAWSSTRSGSGTVALYKNGSSTSLTANGTQTSNALPNGKLLISAFGTSGVASQFSTDQLAAAWYGAGLTGAQAVSIHTRINNFLTAYGTNVY